MGVAFDGDGDRVCLMDGNGESLRGDLMTALVAQELLGAHPGRRVLYDLRASRIVPQVIREAGGEPIRTRVGHAFIKLQMRDAVALFGGELSYHFYFEDFFYCESGIYAMLQVLDIVGRTGKSLAALAAPLRQYAHSGEINFDVTDTNRAIGEIERRFKDGDVDHLDGLTVEYPSWWFNLRPSNTEPLLRLNLEADSEELMKQRLEEVGQLLARFRRSTQ
jgi:phosphomannomutase